MSKRVVTALSIVIGVVALVAMACSQPDVKAPASTDGPGSNVTAPVSIGETTGPPAASPTPVMVSILDTVDLNVCSYIHAIDACFPDGQPPVGILLREYPGVSPMAREHPGRFGIGLTEYISQGESFDDVVIVERLNGGSRAGENERAEELCLSHNLLGIGRSGAHLPRHIATSMTDSKAARNNERTLV